MHHQAEQQFEKPKRSILPNDSRDNLDDELAAIVSLREAVFRITLDPS
jgi:hypothetical protein